MDRLMEAELERQKSNEFIKYNHIRVSDVKPDHAEVYADIVPESLNQMGIVHGGLFFAMADSCAGIAARTDGRRYVTQNAQVNFLKPGKEGRITARASVVNRSRSGALIDVTITDEKEETLFISRVYFYCIAK